MSKSSNASPPRTRAYHHGNLKDALLEAALAVIERDGYESLSMRSLAQEAGVSSAAPYRHFADRSALLAAAACVGYEELRALHGQAMAARGDAVSRLRLAMRSFLDFSQRRRGLFQLMYSDYLRQQVASEALAGLEADVFRDVSLSMAQAVPGLDERSLRLRMAAFWATLYGHAVVRQHGLLRPYMKEGLSDDEIDEAVFAAALGPVAPRG
ncbi:MAG: TetR/AcrR family transcriptional regulator [Pigmentiphaga sp.]|uniref:TetR/AcrR family transcriptional regulator n=1 Tax=Pigmentiphaga sp. TaxID=1977564 RepID=UPI003B580EB5